MQRRLDALDKRHDEETNELREEIERLRASAPPEEDGIDAELQRLLELADEQAAAAEERGESPTEVEFIARGLGLQSLNPEISVTGDVVTLYRDREGEPSEMDFRFRVLGLHFESYLDPYTLMKAAVGVNRDGAGLGEAYVTRFGVLPGLSITAGKFRQQFGVVNRWHRHALDQIDFPMPLTMIFGPAGLNQTGFSFEWMLPDWGDATQEAVLQITGGQNDRVFGENSRHLPCFLLRYKNFRDLSKDVYLEVGGTGLLGFNDLWDVAANGGTVTERERLSTWMLGADLTVRWEPTERMRYSNFEWRTEFYFLDKGILAPDGSGRDRIRAWGAYTSLQRRISRTVEIGTRFDWYSAASKSYALDGALAPLAFDVSDPYRWQVVPYITWWQSPWVRVRLELNYGDGQGMGPREFVIGLQIVFAAGPHKHERY